MREVARAPRTRYACSRFGPRVLAPPSLGSIASRPRVRVHESENYPRKDPVSYVSNEIKRGSSNGPARASRVLVVTTTSLAAAAARERKREIDDRRLLDERRRAHFLRALLAPEGGTSRVSRRRSWEEREERFFFLSRDYL